MRPMRLRQPLIVILSAIFLGTASGFNRLPALPSKRLALQRPVPVVTKGSRRVVVTEAAPLADFSYGAWEWLANLGAPSALVGGAALASFYDLQDDLEPADGDKRWVSVCKKAIVVLFLSAFALEITCIFVTTVTGTLLQGSAVNGMATSSIALMQRELEFEYLASRVTFFQGLLNWLAAVSLQQILPSEGTRGKPFSSFTEEEKTRRRQQLMTSSGMTAMGLMMLAFYNGHMAAGAYKNYGHMLVRLVALTFSRYFGVWPPRPIPLVALVPITAAVANGFRAFRGESAGAR